jgi:ABC-type glycerol-3-phosphate transport system substrate-binding protein
LKNFITKTAAVLLSAVMMTVLFAGCGKSSANIKYSDTTHLFSETEIPIPPEYTYIQGSAYANGKFYLLANREEHKIIPIPEGGHPYAQFMSPEELSTASDGTPIPDGMMEYSIGYTTMIITDENGNIESTKDLSVSDYINPVETSYSYGNLFTSPDGKLLCQKYSNITTKDADGNETYETKRSVIAFDENLNETDYFDIGKALETMPEENRQNYYPQEMLFIGDYLYSLAYDGIFVFNVPNEKYEFSIAGAQNTSGNSEWYQGLFDLGGVAAVAVQSQRQEGDTYISESVLRTIDPAAKAYGTEYDFAEGQTGNAKRGNAEYPIVIASGSELFAFDYLTGEKTLLIDFLASGYTVQDFDSIIIMGSDRFAMIVSEWNYVQTGYNSYSGSSTTSKIVVFNKRPSEDVKPRQLITAYAFYEDRNFIEFAADFNRKNDEYEIELVIYNNDFSEPVEDVVTRFNNDILSGNIPDIILLESNMPYDSYAAKGLFRDLNKHIEKDDEINREDLNEAVLSALEIDGKLYSIPKSFNISALAGKTSIFGGTEKLTPEKTAEVLAAYPDAQLFSMTTQSSFVSQIVSAQLDSFVNKETGEVTFDSPELIEILNIAKTLPAEIDYNNINYDDYQNMIAENRALLISTYIYDFRAYTEAKYTQFKEDYTVMGYPNPNNSGIVLSPSSEIAVMARGNYDAAWEAVKGYLMYKPKDERNSFGLPIWNSELEAMAEAATKPISYVDPATGKTVEVENTVYMNSGEIEIPNNTAADNQAIFDIINRIGGVSRMDISLSKIIEEETSAFFAGTKTAEECARLIQDRASTYIAESR